MVFVGIIDKSASEKVDVDSKNQQFKLDEFLATAIISLLIGILTLGFSWDYTTAQEWFRKRSRHIVHLLDRQDKSNKNRLDQTSTANAHNTNVALTNQRVSTAVGI